MKLVLIHGIAQSGTDPGQLKNDWIEDLKQAGVNPAALAASQPELAYYADILADGRAAIGLQPEQIDSLTRWEFHIEVARELGLATTRIAAGAGEWSNAQLQSNSIAKFATGLLPPSSLLGTWQVRDIVDEIFDYLTEKELRERIDNHVAEFLTDQPMTIIAHSLGSLVAYRILRDRKLACHRLITLGSPLSFSIVRKILGKPFSYPPNLRDWRNFYDPVDLVALGRPFPGHPTWSSRLVHKQVDNREPFGHDADGYLRTPEIAAAVTEVLGG